MSYFFEGGNKYLQAFCVPVFVIGVIQVVLGACVSSVIAGSGSWWSGVVAVVAAVLGLNQRNPTSRSLGYCVW